MDVLIIDIDTQLVISYILDINAMVFKLIYWRKTYGRIYARNRREENLLQIF